MNRTEYMRILENRLTSLSASDREEALQYYYEHFEEGKRAGKTEEEICQKLGDPNKIARFILAEYSVGSLDKKPRGRNIFSAIMSIIGLGFFNLIVTLPFFIVLYSLVFALYVIAIAFVASPFLALVFPWTISIPGITGLPIILLSIGLFFIGLYIFMVSGKIWRGIIKLTVGFLKWNLRVIRND